MKSMFYDIHRTVTNAVERAGYSITQVLGILGIPKSWCYPRMVFSPLLDGRFNPFSGGDEEWTVLGFKHRNSALSFREIAYTLMDEDIAYFSPSTVYNILKKHDLITPWKHPVWESTRSDHAKTPNERWQTDIMYIKIQGRFFYLIIFIDEYSRYIVHSSLLTTLDADSVSLDAQAAIDKLRKDSIAEPFTPGDNGSSFIAMEFRIVLRENHLTQKLIRPHSSTSFLPPDEFEKRWHEDGSFRTEFMGMRSRMEERRMKSRIERKRRLMENVSLENGISVQN